VTDLDERTQKAIAAGIMDEKTAIRNAGGQAYGDRIQEIRFDEIVKMGESTVYTLDDCTQKPHKEEEPVNIFDEDDI
jgi:tRNA A37 N6-isopentenylltransferase MiaA